MDGQFGCARRASSWSAALPDPHRQRLPRDSGRRPRGSLPLLREPLGAHGRRGAGAWWRIALNTAPAF